MVPVTGSKNRSTFASYAGIDNHDVDRRGRVVVVRLGDGQSTIENVEGLHRVANVHDLSIGNDLQDDTLHGPDVVIVESEIRGQGNDGTV